MDIIWAVLLGVMVLLGWLMNLAGTPGNWLIVVTTAIYAWLMPTDLRVSLGWQVVAVLAVLALLGELVELAAGAASATGAGGSRRGAVLALVGGLAGGIAGIFIGMPLPVIGPIVGALLCAGSGALVGAMVGEVWAGCTLGESWQIGKVAFWGRLFGTLGKILIGSVMVAVVLAALVV